MPLWVPDGVQDFGWRAGNVLTTRPNGTTWGTSVTSAASNNTKGSWTQCLSALANDVYWIDLMFTGLGASGLNNQGLMDVGVDPAGGSSYSVLIPDLMVGHCSPLNVGPGIRYFFPLRIRAGSTVAFRLQTATLSQSVRGVIQVYGRPRDPNAVRSGQYVEAFGPNTSNSQGVNLTPGTTSDGSYVSLGTTTKSLWWWQLGFTQNSAGTNGQVFMTDIAYGSSGNELPIITNQQHAFMSANSQLATNGSQVGCEKRVPSGANVYARSITSGVAFTCSAAAYAVGG